MGRLAEAAGSGEVLARIRTKYVKLTGNALCVEVVLSCSGRIVGHSEKALSNQSGLAGVRVDVKWQYR